MRSNVDSGFDMSSTQTGPFLCEDTRSRSTAMVYSPCPSVLPLICIIKEKKPVVLPDSLGASNAMKGNSAVCPMICSLRKHAAHHAP